MIPKGGHSFSEKICSANNLLRAFGASMTRNLAEMWNNGLLLFYGSIALVIAIEIVVTLADNGEGRKRPERPALVSAQPGMLGAIIETSP